MEKASNNPDQINNNVAALQARASSVQGAIYKECRRNYLASIGGYIIDGCTKFVKGSQDDEAKAWFCATCGCHRSFHRKLEPPPLPDFGDTRYSIMNCLRSLHSAAALQHRPPTPWLVRAPLFPNVELIEGQGSSTSPEESESESGDEIDQPSQINKAE